MILSPGCYRLPRLWQNALLSLTCGGLITFCLVPHNVAAQDNIAPIIIGQQPLRVGAGSSLAITLADLQVVDPDNSYPEGFTLRLSNNSDVFQLSDNNIIPGVDYDGSLEVTVVVNDGVNDSDPFTLTVDVTGTNGKGGKDEEKKGGDNKGGPKDKDDKKGDGKAGDGKEAGPKDQDKNKGGGKKDEEKKDGDKKGGPKDDKKDGGKKDDDKKGGDNKGGPKDKDDKKGDGKAGDGKEAGPKDQDKNKDGGKKDEEKKGGDKKGGPKDDKKGGGKKDDDKKGGDNKGGPKDKDDKKGGDNSGPGNNKDEDKGPGQKDEDKKGEENKGPGNNQGDDKGGGKKDDGKDNGGNGGNGGNSGEANNGGGNNAGGNNDGGNNGGGNNGGGNNGGGNGGVGNNNGGGSNGQGNNSGGNNPPPPSNVAPVITGQHEIATAKNVAVVLDLNMLKVDDPDNSYPDDFSLIVFGGNNYALDGNRLIPGHNFTGSLDVRVQVNDGIANSNSFILNISVKEGNIPPQVIGQAPLATDEETPLSIGFSDLIVFDPDSPYPDGFTMNISDGEHHKVDGTTVHPRENFSGPLTVTVTVNDGHLESDPYPLIIAVNPLNDAPVLDNMEGAVMPYVANAGPAGVTERLRVADADGDNIVGAEISFDMATYQSGHDLLTYEPAGQTDLPIEGVFDSENGTLFLIGSAPASAYQTALRSVMYSFAHEDAENVEATTKTLTLTVRDGNVESNAVTREIAFSSEIALDVPRVFTPNGDMANDTWSVTPLQSADEYADAITRVYTIRGQLLYEATGFGWQWDGRYEGEYLPSGTYYYVIAIQSGVKMSNQKGIVTILR